VEFLTCWYKGRRYLLDLDREIKEETRKCSFLWLKERIGRSQFKTGTDKYQTILPVKSIYLDRYSQMPRYVTCEQYIYIDRYSQMPRYVTCEQYISRQVQLNASLYYL